MEQTLTAATPGSPPGPEHSVAVHLGQAQYIRVAVILAVVTAAEVGLYYTDLNGLRLVSLLAGLAAVKFGMVAAYFMHLRFDGQLLRRLFGIGVVLATAVYLVVLMTLDVLVG